MCRAHVQGMKCDVCPEGALLSQDGCQHGECLPPRPHSRSLPASLARTLEGSCSELKCHFGATCTSSVHIGHVQCACQLKCAPETKRAPVCGSDGHSYADECELALHACRYQKHVSVAREGRCPADAETATAGPVRRSTAFRETSDAEKWTREASAPDQTTPTLAAPEERVTQPAFDGSTWLELPRLQAYARLTLELEFTALEPDAILVYNGQTPTGEGDFVALALRDARLEFRYNLGSGAVVLRSVLPVPLGRPVRVVAKRYLWDGSLSVDGQPDVSGRSHGDLKSLDLSENLFVGHVASHEPRLFDNIGTRKGLVGCLLALRIGRKDVDLARDALRTHNARESSSAPSSVSRAHSGHCHELDHCRAQPCANGGTCVAQPHSFRCECGARFSGPLCQLARDACASSPCSSGATCVASEDAFTCTCPPGRTGKLCDDGE